MEETETVTGGIAIATAILVSEIGIGIEIAIVTAIEAAPLPLLTRAAPPYPPARCPSL